MINGFGFGWDSRKENCNMHGNYKKVFDVVYIKGKGCDLKVENRVVGSFLVMEGIVVWYVVDGISWK